MSLRSGARVEAALAALGHQVVALDADESLVSGLQSERPDVAFIALHGPGGEDGTVQSLLELLSIPYTGSAVAASVLCMDKVHSKLRLREAGVPTPEWVAFGEEAFRDFGAAQALPAIERALGLPIVVKPTRQGSALGVRVAQRAEDVPSAIVSALSYDDRVLLERHIDGAELSVSVLDGEPLPIVEVVPEGSEEFDYEARYDLGRTRYECPADLPAEVADRVREVALATWQALGCEGFACVDVMLGNDGPQVLEVNSIPGLTDTSLLPMAADAAGISFERLVARALDLALAR